MPKKNIQEFPAWLDWLDFNLQRGCNRQELIDILLDNDFSKKSIEGALFPALSKPNKAGVDPHLTTPLTLFEPLFAQTTQGLKIHRHKSTKLQLYLIFDFLTPCECNALMALAKKKLSPSSLTIPSEDKEFRTSKTANLISGIDPLIDLIDSKISKYMGIDPEYSEPTQIQHYEVGQQFKRHTDFFEPNSDEYAKFARERGNRTWTFMIYLNNVEKGGETVFPNIKKSIAPKQGLAVVWNNQHQNGCVNYDSLHAGLPVEAGEKFVMTKWFRELKSNGD